jgi:hypothetical protein
LSMTRCIDVALGICRAKPTKLALCSAVVSEQLAFFTAEANFCEKSRRAAL